MDKMTLPQAAERYGKNAESLRQAAHRKTLKAEKVGRDWLVTAEEMERYCASAKVGRPRKS